MRRLYTILLLAVFFNSCKKEETQQDTLTGSWRLVGVYNKTTAEIIPRPADATRDFIINFRNGSEFYGKTFRNTFSNGSYTLTNTNELRFGVYESTKVAEDAWGTAFNQVLVSCLLQSMYPCTPAYISIEANKLKVVSPFFYDLTFEAAR